MPRLRSALGHAATHPLSAEVIAHQRGHRLAVRDDAADRRHGRPAQPTRPRSKDASGNFHDGLSH